MSQCRRSRKASVATRAAAFPTASSLADADRAVAFASSAIATGPAVSMTARALKRDEERATSLGGVGFLHSYRRWRRGGNGAGRGRHQPYRIRGAQGRREGTWCFVRQPGARNKTVSELFDNAASSPSRQLLVHGPGDEPGDAGYDDEAMARDTSTRRWRMNDRARYTLSPDRDLGREYLRER